MRRAFTTLIGLLCLGGCALPAFAPVTTAALGKVSDYVQAPVSGRPTPFPSAVGAHNRAGAANASGLVSQDAAAIISKNSVTSTGRGTAGGSGSAVSPPALNPGAAAGNPATVKLIGNDGTSLIGQDSTGVIQPGSTGVVNRADSIELHDSGSDVPPTGTLTGTGFVNGDSSKTAVSPGGNDLNSRSGPPSPSPTPTPANTAGSAVAGSVLGVPVKKVIQPVVGSSTTL